MSHDVQPDEEEPRQEVVGGKRLADHPSVVLEKAVEEGPRPPKVPRLQARKAVPPLEDKSLGAPTLDDIDREAKEETEMHNFKVKQRTEEIKEEEQWKRANFLLDLYVKTTQEKDINLRKLD